MNRREFMRLGAAGLIGAAAGCSPQGQLIYRSGETIRTPYGDINIHGWKVDFKTEDFKRYAKDHPDRELRVTLTSPEKKSFGVINEGPRGGFFLSYIDDDSKTGIRRMRGLPDKNEHATLDVEEKTEDGLLLFHRQYPIEFTYHTYESDSTDTTDFLYRSAIYAEVSIGKSELKAISDISKDFKGFVFLPPPIYLYFNPDNEFDIKIEGDESNRGGSTDNRDGQIFISAKNLLKPQAPRQGEMIAFHELAHRITNQMREYDNIEHMSALEREFQRMSDGRGYDNPHFALFTESRYEKRTPRMGHPSSNHDELFASVMTVFRYFPAEFLEMSRKDPMARTAARTILKIVGELDYRGENKTTLLPAYQKLAADLKVPETGRDHW